MGPSESFVDTLCLKTTSGVVIESIGRYRVFLDKRIPALSNMYQKPRDIDAWGVVI